MRRASHRRPEADAIPRHPGSRRESGLAAQFTAIFTGCGIPLRGNAAKDGGLETLRSHFSALALVSAVPRRAIQQLAGSSPTLSPALPSAAVTCTEFEAW